VPPSVTSTSPATTSPALKRMSGPCAKLATSPAFASWASRHISDSASDVSDDSSPEGLSLQVAELENARYNQDKLLGKVFCENKKLNLELESTFLKLFFFDPHTMILVLSHVTIAK
jgi:hypothetical protein